MILDGFHSPWMDEELDDLARLARTFVERELMPHQERFARQQQVDRETWTAGGEAGLLCLSIPEAYGGGGGTFAHEAVVARAQALAGEDAWGNAVHSVIVAHYLLAYGTEEQKRRWLPRMASGELVGAIAMTEPGTGSDLQRIRTRAVRDGDDLVINGAKTFISNGTHGSLVVVAARTGEQEGGSGLSLVVVETDGLPGFERGRVLDKIGQHGQDTRELSFTDVRVPAGSILGGPDGEGLGFAQLMAQLPQERLIIAVVSAAAAEAAVRLASAYAREREAFGVDLMALQNTRFVLAECAADTLAARTLVDSCIAAHLEGRLDAAGASLAKFWCSDIQGRVVDRCLQVFGGYGYTTEFPIARLYTAARVQRIYGGTNEIMKELVARAL